MTSAPQALTSWFNNKSAQPVSGNGLLSSAQAAGTTSIPGATASSNTPTAPAADGLLSTASNSSNTVSSNNNDIPGLLSNANTKIGPTTYTAATTGPQTNWNVTPDQTVAGQVNNVIGQDSPLMQQAATKGLALANSRGLLNSSISAGESQNSVLSAALPIAQQDATTNSQAAGYNADTANKNNTNNTSAINAARSTNAQAVNQANEYNATNDFTAGQTAYNAQQNATLAAINNQANLNQQQLNQVGSLSQDFNNNIQTIQSNPNMTQDAKGFYINQLLDAYKSQLTLFSNVGNVPNVAELLAPNSLNSNAQKPAGSAVFAPAPQPQPAQAQASGGTVICTRLYELGLMDYVTYRADTYFGTVIEEADPNFVAWYRRNAAPIVKKMHCKTSSSLVFTAVINTISKPWAKEMAYRVGIGKKSSSIGSLIMNIGIFAYTVSKRWSKHD